jgi:hypothetical protein
MGGVGLGAELHGAAGVGGGDAGEDAAEGGFAGAVFTYEGVDFAGAEVEGDAVEDGVAGVGFGEVLGGEKRHDFGDYLLREEHGLKTHATGV